MNLKIEEEGFDMKKVALIFRSKKRNEFSIEALFNSMYQYLSNDYHVDNYYLPNGHYNKMSYIIENYRYAKRIDADIYHISGEVYFITPAFPKEKIILTVHDFVDLENMKGIKRMIRYIFWYYIPFHHCKYIACISHNTYRELESRFPFAKNKIIYSPNPISDKYIRSDKEFNGLCPQILIVGTRINKNIDRIISAVKGIKCKLLIIGKLSDQQKKLLSNNKVMYKNVFHISDNDMINAYIESDMLCFPSLYEGFGRPIIEANAIGRPVITSKIEPMIEVGGDAALFVDPYDIKSIRNGILSIIKHDDLRNKLIHAGYENAEKYRAKNVAHIYKKIYKKVDV